MPNTTPPPSLLADRDHVQLPTEERMTEIYRRAAELCELEEEIERRERELKDLKDDHRHLASGVLPKMFDEVHGDKFGVPGKAADVVLQVHVHAAIRKDWPQEQQERGFAELERLGADDMIKHVVAVEFGKGEQELAAQFLRHVRGLNWLGGRSVTVDKSVHWGTLTKFLREMIDHRVNVDLAAIGGDFARKCVVKWRRRSDK